MAQPRPLEFLEQLQNEYPQAASDIGELGNLYTRKLWHQLTVKIDDIFKADGPLNSGDVPIRLFNSFVLDFGQRMNLLKFAQFAVHATKSLATPQAMVDFLTGVVAKLEEMKMAQGKEPILFLRMHITQHQIELGDLASAKEGVSSGRDTLAGLSDADPSVSASVFYVASLLAKAQADYAEFYRTSLMYLSYVSSDALPQDFKGRLAVDVGLAALLGKGVYSFGQLLQHPIAKVLEGGAYAWLHDILVAFNAGDLPRYDALCAQHAAVLNAQPALVAAARELREKVTLMALLDLISSTPPEARCLPLDTVGGRTRLDRDGVEFLLMKALALHLIEGSLDAVGGTVTVTWVTPRVLTLGQVAGLKARLDAWSAKVAAAAATLEHESVGVGA
uniref:PCI domain-containing protein n=1 Tax=Chlamydomonas leiostraca TaxID=1034604 RepID=A0A7S0RYM3_9CHLO|mmetsp:Transcript_34723/g.87861  ORF Transcript_34723/g.87861 Transcript_34723/m.87861 type:complete len:390 (+) Transcript_34723:124-1293(+)|eukprot:CAMPEP_0202869058 /NCGR_PEP_ID=MMETSP1391-20130828/11759_1 /ASSEMBLY_ACC=CAM_ASM_000867 /TAXON_ID=1034604 /ORGANISM="Chlamydomonas leiostraca, Strain SAG 11-49" /LENGTH=389 /DNA_ID=CAMNT_0049549309 /DNA_START=116 /DNA_END=1285 /DNA_ORIENTATION=+